MHRKKGECPAVSPPSHAVACHHLSPHAQNTPASARALPAAVGAATLPSCVDVAPGSLVTCNQETGHLPPTPYTHTRAHTSTCRRTPMHTRAHPRMRTGCSVSGLWEALVCLPPLVPRGQRGEWGPWVSKTGGQKSCPGWQAAHDLLSQRPDGQDAHAHEGGGRCALGDVPAPH